LTELPRKRFTKNVNRDNRGCRAKKATAVAKATKATEVAEIAALITEDKEVLLMTFKRCLAAGLLSTRNKILYLFVVLYIVIYVLGVVGVLPPFSGRFIAPSALLAYALLSAVFEAAATTVSESDEADGTEDNDGTAEKLRYRVVRNAATGELFLPLSDISAGDSVICSKGDFIPFSGDVVGGHAYVIENGNVVEKRPSKGRDRKESFHIKSGSVIYAGNILIEVAEEIKSGKVVKTRKSGKGGKIAYEDIRSKSDTGGKGDNRGKTDNRGLGDSRGKGDNRGLGDSRTGSQTEQKSSGHKLSYIFSHDYYKNRSLLWWVRRIAVLLAVIMFVIRFFISDMIVLGSYEALLDNLCLSFCIVCLAMPFCQGDGVFSAAFAKMRKLRIKPGTDLEKLGLASTLAVDGKLLYPQNDPVFCVVMANGLDNKELQNLTDITKVPEPIRSLLAVNIKTMTENRYGFVSNEADAAALRRFAQFDADDYAESDIEMLTEIPETPETRYAAATFRQFGLTATEYYGKPNFRKNGYAHDEAGRKLLEPATIDKLYAVFKTLAKEGKRVRIAAVNRSHIHNGVLPSEGWLILGYFVFPAVPTFAVKKSIIAAANEGYKISLINGANSPVYGDYLINTLRLEKPVKDDPAEHDGGQAGQNGLSREEQTGLNKGQNELNKGQVDRGQDGLNKGQDGLNKGQNERSKAAFDASIVADAFSLAKKADFVIAAGSAGEGVKCAADAVTKSEDPAEGFTEAVSLIGACKRLRAYVKIFSILTLLLVLFVFVLYTFVLSPLPVAVGDDVIPTALATVLVVSLAQLLFIRVI
jgi:hypothetical protein